MRRIILTALVLFGGGAALVFGTAAGNAPEYRVLAIFDNSNQVTIGEQVRIAGVTVGVIEKLSVTPENKAGLTLRIDNPGYRDFRSDASCVIRPQSLIGEQFVECTPTRPKASGVQASPPLKQITSGDYEGQYLLPVENTSSPVGIDLINNIMRVPQRQRFALILNEFGVALAGNGQSLNTVVRRGYPALNETNKVLKILAGQNRLLADLAVKSDQSLTPLAAARKEVSGLINASEQVGRATAEKGAELQQNWEKLPTFVAQLTPTMQNLEAFSKSLSGFLSPLQGHEAQINSITGNFPALAANSTASVNGLANPVASTATTVLTDNVQRLATLDKLATGLKPLASNLGGLLQSFQSQGGWEFLMQTLYFQTGAANGYNKYGHYSRGELVLYPVGACSVAAQGRGSTYGLCSANFDHGVDSGSSGSAAMASVAMLRQMARSLGSLFGTGKNKSLSAATHLKPLAIPDPPRQVEPKPAPAPAKKPEPSTKATPVMPKPAPEAKAPAAAAPAPGSASPSGSADPSSSDTAQAKAAMLRYLMGGGSR